jgi:hypothetical protein
MLSGQPPESLQQPLSGDPEILPIEDHNQAAGIHGTLDAYTDRHPSRIQHLANSIPILQCRPDRGMQDRRHRRDRVHRTTCQPLWSGPSSPDNCKKLKAIQAQRKGMGQNARAPSLHRQKYETCSYSQEILI